MILEHLHEYSRGMRVSKMRSDLHWAVNHIVMSHEAATNPITITGVLASRLSAEGPVEGNVAVSPSILVTSF